MIRQPKKFYALLFSFALLALLAITVVFRCINAPIERNIAELQTDMTEAARVAASEHEARMTEQLQHIKPTVEYCGHLFVEGMHIPGEATHYCKCSKCCGKWANASIRKTADGTRLDEIDRTGEKILSCNWLPFDTVVAVNGTEYRTADRGGHGLDEVGIVDIYVPGSHQDALNAGRLYDADIVIISLPNTPR